MTLPPDYWLLGRDEYVKRCTDFCNRLLTALVGRYDRKYLEINPVTDAPFKEPNLFSMDLDEDEWQEFVDGIGYRRIMGKAKTERLAALSGGELQQED